MARATALLLAICALGPTAGSALAKAPSSQSIRNVGTPPGFALEGSNGYSIFVLGVPAYEGKPASVGIFITGKADGAFYSTPAEVGDGSIHADLGDLGEIAVTFRPSGGDSVVTVSDCGSPLSFDAGSFEGTIAFHGELGYTNADATSARGDIGFLASVVCPGSGGSTGPFLPGARLKIEARESRYGPHLTVVKNRPSARAHFEVGVSEKRAGIEIGRFTSMFMPPQSFKYDPKVRTATVDPPAPFSGTAQFHRNAKPANRWTGDLTVDLPGREDVELTGRDFRAGLAHAHWDWHPPGRWHQADPGRPGSAAAPRSRR